MSVTPASPVATTAATSLVPGPPGVRRVRHQARDAVAVMAFSAATSLGLATVLLLLPHLLPGLGR